MCPVTDILNFYPGFLQEMEMQINLKPKIVTTTSNPRFLIGSFRNFYRANHCPGTVGTQYFVSAPDYHVNLTTIFVNPTSEGIQCIISNGA